MCVTPGNTWGVTVVTEYISLGGSCMTQPMLASKGAAAGTTTKGRAKSSTANGKGEYRLIHPQPRTPTRPVLEPRPFNADRQKEARKILMDLAAKDPARYLELIVKELGSQRSVQALGDLALDDRAGFRTWARRELERALSWSQAEMAKWADLYHKHQGVEETRHAIARALKVNAPKKNGKNGKRPVH